MSVGPSRDVVFDANKWANFVNDAGMRMDWSGAPSGVKVYDYYGCSPEMPSSRTGDDFDKVVHELFLDAVAVGAIILPCPYEAESFQFVDSGRLSSGWRTNITLKGDAGGVSYGLEFDFVGDPYMGSVSVLDAIARMAGGVQNLVGEAEHEVGMPLPQDLSYDE